MTTPPLFFCIILSVFAVSHLNYSWIFSALSWKNLFFKLSLNLSYLLLKGFWWLSFKSQFVQSSEPYATSYKSSDKYVLRKRPSSLKNSISILCELGDHSSSQCFLCPFSFTFPHQTHLHSPLSADGGVPGPTNFCSVPVYDCSSLCLRRRQTGIYTGIPLEEATNKLENRLLGTPQPVVYNY